MFMKKYELLGTLGCHLCDVAAEILWPLTSNTAFRFDEVDIADSPELLDHYALLIPVLRDCVNGTELRWPFTVDEVESFLGN